MDIRKIVSTAIACAITIGMSGITYSDIGNHSGNMSIAYAADNNAQGYPKLDSLKEDSKVPSPSKKSTSGLTYKEGVLIVNNLYSIPSSYAPSGGKLESVVQQQFTNMQKAAEKAGKTLVIGKGYVSYTDLKKTYDSLKKVDGTTYKSLKGLGLSEDNIKKNIDMSADIPGHSELQTGLSVCIKNSKNGSIDSANFKKSAEYTWLKDNAHKYGFIERYPEGQQSYTGKTPRPYQWTYVGKAKATAIHNAGVSLENYLGIKAPTSPSSSSTDTSGSTSSGSEEGSSSESGGSTNGEDGDRSWDKKGAEEDPDWLVSKDDWRHGIYHDNGGDGNLVEYKLGMASGKYAISLEDGKWYWYHQGNDACDYCGDWSDKIWADGKALSKTGSPVYAMSILVSNLTNTATTPAKLLEDSGAKNEKKFDISGSCLFDKKGEPKSVDEFKKFLEDKYDLDVTKISVDKKETCKTQIDNILKKGGMVLYRHNSTSKGTWWPAIDTKSHFICIRKTSSGKYYILDQMMKDFDDMNNGIDFDTIWNNMVRNGANTYLLGVVNPNVIYIGGASSGKWITDAASIGTYKNTISLGSDGGQNYFLYDGLPWKYESGAYFVDLNQAAIDLESYVKGVSSNKTMQSGMGYSSVADIVNETNSWIASRATNQNGYPVMNGGFSRGSTGQYKVLDGLACVGFGPPPAVVDPNYCVNFGAYSEGKNLWLVRTTPEGYGYGSRKYCGVFKDISGGSNDGKLYYLPLAASDAKAHTFPGGIGQTGICLNGNYSPDASGALELDSSGNPKKIKSIYVAEHGYDFATKIANKDWSSLMDIMNTKYHYSSNDNVTQWDRLWNIGEFTNVPGCVASKVINSGNYKLIGFVAYPD